MNHRKIVWWLGLGLTLLVSFFNQGIIALDDYYEIIAHIIPAQTSSFSLAITEAGFRSPFPSVVLLALTKFALFLGLESPISQLRFVMLCLGGGIYALMCFCASGFFSTTQEKLISSFLVSFYFVLPLLYGRPLIENLSGAFLVLGAFFAFKLCQTEKPHWLFFSILSISIASLFRFQTGVCILALPLLLLLRKQHKVWDVFFLSLLFCFFLTGTIDWLLTGGFHRSVIAYTSYNISHSSSYGTTPFYTFFLLFFGLSIPPTFLGSYKGFSWKKQFEPLLPVALFFFVFVIAHSFVPHKEERFMIPVLVLFLILLTPIACFWAFEKKSKWRVGYFCALNFLLLFLTSTSAPQNNVISLVRYLDEHPTIKTVVNSGDSVVLFPKAFTLREDIEIRTFDFFSVSFRNLGCSTAIAIREGLYEGFGNLKVLAQFSPGPLEALLVKLNPRQNARRGTILLLGDETCD